MHQCDWHMFKALCFRVYFISNFTYVVHLYSLCVCTECISIWDYAHVGYSIVSVFMCIDDIHTRMCTFYIVSAISFVYVYLCLKSVYSWNYVLVLCTCQMVCSSVFIFNTYMYMMYLYLFLELCAYMLQIWLTGEGCCDCKVHVCTGKHTCGWYLKFSIQLYKTVVLTHWIAFPILPVLPSILISLGKIYPQILPKVKTRKFFNGFRVGLGR